MDPAFSDLFTTKAQFDPTTIMLVLFRITSLLVGAFLLFLGYKLFKIGYFEKAGELVGVWGNKRLVLKQVAPGVFFALFGTVIVCVGTWKPISIQSNAAVPATIVGALQKAADNQQLSDDEKKSITAWLKQRNQINWQAYTPSGLVIN
jgi:hypothetical protein